MHLRIATRQSALALWQAEHVAEKLAGLKAVTEVTLVPLSTKGDEILDRSLQKIGGKGLFIKELEIAMQEDRADLAVHSMKDVPADMPDGFVIAALLERANPADALVSAGSSLAELRTGAVVGSSSLRRQAQLRALRPDIAVKPLRGNVATRLGKLDDGEFDAIVLAAAGLERLGMADRIAESFEPARMLPATAQGVIGIECLAARSDLVEVLAELDHDEARQTTSAERAVAARLEATCQSPVASYATVDQGQLHIDALVAAADGSRILRARETGPCADAERLGRAAADHLLAQGAAELLGEPQA